MRKQGHVVVESLAPKIWIFILQNICPVKRCSYATVCKEWQGLLDTSITTVNYNDSYRMGLSRVSRLSCLTSFDGDMNNAEELQLLAPHIISLRELRLREAHDSTNGVYNIQRFTNLTTLRLADFQHIKGDGLLGLRYLIQLDLESNISSTNPMIKLPVTLRVLTLRDVEEVNGDELLCLTNLTSLKLVQCINISMSSIVKLTQLNRLSLDCYTERDSFISPCEAPGFLQFTSLSLLTLKNESFSLFQYLQSLTALRSLKLETLHSVLPTEILLDYKCLTRLVINVQTYPPVHDIFLQLTSIRALSIGSECALISSATLSCMTQLTSLTIQDALEVISDNWLSALVNLESFRLCSPILSITEYASLPVSLRTLALQYNQHLNNTVQIIPIIATRLTNLKTLGFCEEPTSIYNRQPLLHIARDRAWKQMSSLQSLETIYCYGEEKYLLKRLLPRVDVI